MSGLFLLEMTVDISQYRGSVGIVNNRKVFHFTYLSDGNNNNKKNDNSNNLAIGSLILLNKIGLILLLLTLMFGFKDNASKHKKIVSNGNASKHKKIIFV